MDRNEYISILENNLMSLTEDEKKEAISYYTDYFEEAGDDQKVIEELGTPEELAKTIVEKFANALVGSRKSEEKHKSSENADNEDISPDALYYSFPADSVTSLLLSFGAAEIVVISGDSFSVETRGLASDLLVCKLSEDGVLSISNSRKMNYNFWSHDRNRRIVPRILLTVPEQKQLEKLAIIVGAGDFRTKGGSFTYEEGKFEVGAGKLVLDNLKGEKSSIRCGMGEVTIQGRLSGKTSVDCGMGSVKLLLNGNPADFSYDAKVGLGEFKFNNEKRSGVCKVFDNCVKKNHFSVNCGMGNVVIKVEE